MNRENSGQHHGPLIPAVFVVLLAISVVVGYKTGEYSGLEGLYRAFSVIAAIVLVAGFATLIQIVGRRWEGRNQ